MENEDEIMKVMLDVSNNLKSLNSKNKSLNWSTIITSLVSTFIVSLFVVYIAYVRFSERIEINVNANTIEINEIKEKELPQKVNWANWTTHMEQDNYNFGVIGEKLNIQLIEHNERK